MASDDFNRAAENPLASPWTTNVGNGFKIVTNGYCQIVNASNQDSVSYYSSSSVAESSITVQQAPTEQYIGPAIHCASGNCYVFFCLGGTATLAKFTTGTYSVLLTNSSGIPTVTAGSVLRMWRSAGTIHVSVDGSEITALQSSDSSFTTGSPGIYAYNNNNYIDSWTDGAGGGSTTKPAYYYAQQ